MTHCLIGGCLKKEVRHDHDDYSLLHPRACFASESIQGRVLSIQPNPYQAQGSVTILFKKRNPKIHRGKNYKESGQCLLSLRWGWRRWRWRQGGWWRCWQQREWLCGLPSVWVSWEVSGSGETFLLPTERHCVALIAVQCKQRRSNTHQRRSNTHSLQISELLVYLSVAELLFWVSRSQNNQYLPPILWVWSLSVSPYLYYPSLY